jgi:uncharacterized protein YkwD
MITRRVFTGLAAALPCLALAELPESDFAHSIFEKINELRMKRGSAPLEWSAVLEACATEQSRRKALIRFAGHTDPDRGDVAARLNTAGVRWAVCGENLFQEKGWDDPANLAVVFWWYSTSGHQENLLDPRYTQSAIGVVRAEDGTFFVTQIFIRPPAAHEITRNRD